MAQDGCKPIDQDVAVPSTSTKHSGARDGEDLNGNIENETPTILGQQMPNPYAVPNMKQAYQNLGRSNWNDIVATHYYVRFKPSANDQLLTLEESLDLDLFDTPLDYMISQEGDYYQDPAVPDDQITYQYAVVPTNFSFPSGIAYDIVSPIHLPDDIALETEAERLVGLNGDGELGCTQCSTPNKLNGPHPNVLDCGPDAHYDYSLQQCVPNNCAAGQHYDGVSGTCIDNCPAGYYWDDNLKQCVSNTPPPPPGQITVFDTQLGNQGVRQANMVAKRWFKIERIYTDDNGLYHFSKHFGRKVKVLMKFKNGDATVRGIRKARLWQFFYPVKYDFGRYDGTDGINGINYTFAHFNDASSRGARYWAAASVQNAVQQYKNLVAAQGTASQPGNLKILLTNFSNGVNGSTPLFHTRNTYGIVEAYLRKFIMDPWPVDITLGALVGILEQQVDMTIGYGANNLPSDVLIETVFHELPHAATYNQAGSDWYSAFVNAEIHEIVYSSSDNSPYGDGTTIYSPIIAVGESWAYHYGHFLADVRYGTNSTCQIEQKGGATYCGAQPHINVLEGFNPNLVNDPFRWIPKGIYLDLNDNGSERFATSLINDQVSGYTNQQMFQAIESDVRSLQTYRDRLLSKNGNNQAVQVQNLFHQYNYD